MNETYEELRRYLIDASYYAGVYPDFSKVPGAIIALKAEVKRLKDQAIEHGIAELPGSELPKEEELA